MSNPAVDALMEAVMALNEASKATLAAKRAAMAEQAGIEQLKKFGVEIPKNER